MTSRVTQVVLLCEDSQHEAFARRFLGKLGVSLRAIRVVKSPKGRGSGEHWVKLQYSQEVRHLRSNRYIVGRALVVMVDEDTSSTQARGATLSNALERAGLPPRIDTERIVHAIPARNIETWLAYLDGSEVDEQTVYPKLERQKDCARLVDILKRMCDEKQLRPPAPPSLIAACTEFRSRWKP